MNVTLSGVRQTIVPISGQAHSANETGPGSEPIAASATEAGGGITLSKESLIASDLFDEANAFVTKEHIAPFTGYDHGNVSQGAYLNVEKYNNHVFEKAAATMVGKAAESGLVLNKDDIVSALKAANSDIAAMKTNITDRNTILGASSVLTDLAPSDLNNLTDMYISAKEHGLNPAAIDGVAVSLGLANRDDRLGIETAVYDPKKEKTGYGTGVSGDRVDVHSSNEFDQIKTALYGKLGLSDRFVNLLVDSSKVGNASSRDMLSFLAELISIQGQNRVLSLPF